MPASSSASPTSRSAPCASRWRSCPSPTPTARPICRSTLPRRRQDQPAARSRRDRAAARIRRPHHRAHHHAARRHEERPHRHQAAVQGRRWSAKARRRRFEAIVLGADGKAVEAKGLKWELLRLDQRWQWYSRDGSWDYEAVTQHARVAAGTLDATAAGAPAKIEAARRLGPLSPRGDAPIRTARPPAPSSMPAVLGRRATPTAPRCSTSRSTSRATGRRHRAAAGSPRARRRALIAVLSTPASLSTQEVDMPAGGGEVAIGSATTGIPAPTSPSCSTGRMDEKAKRMPSRAIGLRWLGIDQAARTLGVSLDVPEKVKSGSMLTVPVKVARPGRRRGGARHGCRRRRRHPQPHALRGAQARRLVLRPAPARHGDPRPLRPPDRRHARRARQAALRRRRRRRLGHAGQPAGRGDARAVLRHRQVGADGTARVEFQLPDFNGTVRLTAVAWSADKVGSGSKDVIVRDPVALTVSAPRFLTLGDQARLELACTTSKARPAAYT